MTAWTVALMFVLQGTGPGPGARPQDDPLEPARELYRGGRMEEAVRQMDELCRKNPANGMSWLVAADFLVQQRDFDRCLPFARRAVELAPQVPRSFAILGMIHLEKGEYPDCERVFREAVRRFPENAGMQFNLGMACGLNQKTQEAQELFDRALAREPDNPQFLFSAGENYVARMMYDDAVRVLTAAATGERRHPDAPWKLAQVYEYKEMPEEAEQWFRRGLQTPDEPSWHHALQRSRYYFAVFLHDQRRFREALDLLNEFIRHDPAHRMSWMYLARCQRGLGQVEASRTSIARYQELQAQQDRMETEQLLDQIQGLRPRGADPSRDPDSGAGSDGPASDDRKRNSPVPRLPGPSGKEPCGSF